MTLLTSITSKIIYVKIRGIDTRQKIIFCDMPSSEIGYIPFEEYDIYHKSANKIPKDLDTIAVICQNYDENYKMFKLSSKAVQEAYWATLKCGDLVSARVTKIATDKIAFCDIGYRIKGSIALDGLIKIPNSFDSIADVLKPGDVFDAKICNRSNRGNFMINTKGISEYEDIHIGGEGIIVGIIGNKVKDPEIFKNNQYHYYFHITFQCIGYITSERPLKYATPVYGKLLNRKKLTFKRWDSSIIRTVPIDFNLCSKDS